MIVDEERYKFSGKMNDPVRSFNVEDVVVVVLKAIASCLCCQTLGYNQRSNLLCNFYLPVLGNAYYCFPLLPPQDGLHYFVGGSFRDGLNFMPFLQVAMASMILINSHASDY